MLQCKERLGGQWHPLLLMALAVVARGVLEATSVIGFPQIILIVQVVWISQVCSHLWLLQLGDMMRGDAVVDDALEAVTGAERGPRSRFVPETARVVAQLYFRLQRLVHHRVPLEVGRNY